MLIMSTAYEQVGPGLSGDVSAQEFVHHDLALTDTI